MGSDPPEQIMDVDDLSPVASIVQAKSLHGPKLGRDGAERKTPAAPAGVRPPPSIRLPGSHDDVANPPVGQIVGLVAEHGSQVPEHPRHPRVTIVAQGLGVFGPVTG